MKTRIQKWGNSLALRIPKSFATEAGLNQNGLVELALEDGKLTIEPISQPSVRLDELLNGITSDNLHQEVDTGPATGNEVW